MEPQAQKYFCIVSIKVPKKPVPEEEVHVPVPKRVEAPPAKGTSSCEAGGSIVIHLVYIKQMAFKPEQAVYNNSW